MLGFYRCTDTCLKMLTIDEQIFIYSIITFFQLYIKMFKRQNISISLFLSGRLPAFWAGYSFFIKWPHIFKNTPWGRAVPSLIEKTTIPCVLWRKKKIKKRCYRGKTASCRTMHTVWLWLCEHKSTTLWCMCLWM